MSYLLDTCIISELRKDVPDHVKLWFSNKNPESFYISVVTVAELLDGIERLPSSKKKKDLMEWHINDVLNRFQDKIFPIDESIARAWGRLSASLRQKGVTIGVQDIYLAATTQIHALTLVTTNIKHFKDTDIPVINPWEGHKGQK